MAMADRIQYLRKVRGISQEALADNVGVSRQAVSKWESEHSISSGVGISMWVHSVIFN